MWWKGRRRPGQNAQPACDRLAANALAAHREAVDLVRAGVTARAAPLVDIVITRLLWLVWDLPNWTDGNDTFGFFRSGLATAARALDAFAQTTTWRDHAPSLVARHHLEPLWRAGVAIGGLFGGAVRTVAGRRRLRVTWSIISLQCGAGPQLGRPFSWPEDAST